MNYRAHDPQPLFVHEPQAVGSYDAKTRLAELLTAVETGASFVITRHGKNVARLLPVEPVAPGSEVVREILALRAGQLAGASMRELVEEGRR